MSGDTKLVYYTVEGRLHKKGSGQDGVDSDGSIDTSQFGALMHAFNDIYEEKQGHIDFVNFSIGTDEDIPEFHEIIKKLDERIYNTHDMPCNYAHDMLDSSGEQGKSTSRKQYVSQTECTFSSECAYGIYFHMHAKLENDV
jgi:hypothetical protein